MIGHYLSTALRGFRRDPLSTAIKLLALALGLACLLTAHVIGDYFRQADRQWEKASRIYVVVQETARAGGGWDSSTQLAASAPVAAYLRAEIPELEATARLTSLSMSVRRPGVTAPVMANGVDPEFLDIFDLDMLAGEAVLDRPGGVLLSERAALVLFGGEDPIGQTLTVQLAAAGGVDVSVVGVYREPPLSSHLNPGGSSIPSALVSISTADEVYAALMQGPRLSERQDFQSSAFLTYVVLPADGSLNAGRLNRLLADVAARRAPPESLPGNMEIRFRAMPVRDISEARFNRQIGAPFNAVTALYLLGALTLAMGCVNFANLSAAAAATRAREIGLRKTVGASRRQVAAQMLTESLILAAAALVLALPIADALAQTIAARFSLPLESPGAGRLDYWASVAAILLAVAAAAGAYPALVLANLRPVFAMRMSGLRSGSGRARTTLIGVQFAAAAFLICLVLVMLAQQSGLRETVLRPDEDPIVSLPSPSAQAADAQRDQAETIRQQLLSSPAIRGFSLRNAMPFMSPIGTASEYAQSLDASAHRFTGQARRISYDYFATMDVRIVAGREFSRDLDETFSVVIDTATARLMGYAPHEAIGQPIYRVGAAESFVDAGQTDPYEFRIIGVVEREPLELTAAGPTNFLYVLQPLIGGFAVIRLSRDNVEGGLEHIRRTWETVAGQQAMPTFLDEFFEQQYRAYLMMTFVVIVLSCIAVAIAAMGLFGMASFVVQRRAHEIGVRKTLGASTPRVLAMMLWDFSKPVIAANLIAWPFAWLAARAYLNLFVTRIDLTPLPFLAALGASLLIAWLAVAVHAVRAASVKPALVLHAE